MPSLKRKKKPPPAAVRRLTETTLIGWRGVTVEVPEDWSPTAVSGEGASGYLRIASPDSRVLEIKWEETKEGAVDLSKALSRYTRTLERAARKSKRPLTWRVRPKQLSAIRPQRQHPIPYAWEADRKAYGCIWHCAECRRLVIAELVGEAEDDLALAPAILRSIRDHSEEGWTTWALYGFGVEVPSRFALERQHLMTGHIRLQFRERSRALQADRWGLASVVLKDARLKDWFMAQMASQLGHYRCRFEEIEINGHPALRLQGPERPLLALKRLIGALFTLSWPAWWMKGYVWSCPEANKIFALTSVERRRDRLLDDVVGRMRCHEQEAGRLR